MKRIAWLSMTGLGAAGLLVAASVARADDSSSSGTADQSSALKTYPDAVYRNDVVQKMDASTHQITLASAGTKQVSSDCKVMKNGKTASMADVHEGDQIRAAMSGQGDAAKVVEIIVIQPKAGATGK